MLTYTRVVIIVLMIAAVTVVTSAIVTKPVTATVQLPAGLTDQQLQDTYAAFSDLERAAERGANAVHNLRKGQVASVDLTAEQLTAILSEGKGAIVQARNRYADLLAILGIAQAELDLWEGNNPQESPTYCTLDPSACPPPTPTPTPIE
ncbi:hypothetical protein LCGC14_1421560 [marine sediment metagenome]|uniref:Uncharacterized protein n=1 Tax=marine sediment metagenome TaxID=412755 RepID=A0A0F9MSX6_9ZZZZ